MQNLKYSLYTDGSCNPNPGKGAWAYALLESHYKPIDTSIPHKSGSGIEDNTTCNRMELQAIIAGLRSVYTPSHIIVYSDSAYCINIINKHINIFNNIAQIRKFQNRISCYKNKDLYVHLFRAVKLHQKVECIHVPGHSGDYFNELVHNMCYKLITTKKCAKIST